MFHAYIDESERDEDFYFLSAVLGTRDQIFDLCESLKSVMRKHAKTFPHLKYTDELHGSSIMGGRVEPWKSIPIRAKFSIYLDALIAIRESSVTVMIEGIDINAQKARGYPTLTPARELAFSHLLEKINACADSSTLVQVHADDHHTADVSRSNFANYQSVGTYGYKSSRLQNIMPEILFEDSRFELGLQAADLVTYIYNRLHTITETDHRANRQKHKLWDAIRPATEPPRGSHRIWG